MRVGFDARMINHPGIGRYIKNILKNLLDNTTDAEFILYGDPQKLEQFKNAEIRPYNAGIYSIKELVLNPFKKDSLDVVHIPHFNTPFLKIKNLVVTIHDLIYLRLPESRSAIKGALGKLIISNALDRAKKIIAVSNYTKNDITKTFPNVKNKTEVIYEACDPEFKIINDAEQKRCVIDKYRLPADFMLFVGSLKNHKNIPRLIDAYLSLQKNGLKNKLVIVGRFSPHESAILDKIKTSDALYLGEIPNNDLTLIYNLASLLILPSLFEGFGLPILEAMACGLPVIASNVTSIPEIITDKNALFDPLDVKNISSKIYSALNDPDLRNSLITYSHKRALDFSWKKAALETFEIYKQAAS